MTRIWNGGDLEGQGTVMEQKAVDRSPLPLRPEFEVSSAIVGGAERTVYLGHDGARQWLADLDASAPPRGVLLRDQLAPASRDKEHWLGLPTEQFCLAIPIRQARAA